MPEFEITFCLTGTVSVQADNTEEAIAKAKKVSRKNINWKNIDVTSVTPPEYMYYKNFQLAVSWSERDGNWIGSTVGKENIRCSGSNYRQLLEDFHHAVDSFLLQTAHFTDQQVLQSVLQVMQNSTRYFRAQQARPADANAPVYREELSLTRNKNLPVHAVLTDHSGKDSRVCPQIVILRTQKNKNTIICYESDLTFQDDGSPKQLSEITEYLNNAVFISEKEISTD